MATGTVQRFDARRGYGFIRPDGAVEDSEGKVQDVFVHQNNIDMAGFRSLHINEKVTYDEEVGDKGMKAVNVRLVNPRPPQSDHRPVRAPASGTRRSYHGGSTLEERFNKLIQLLSDVQVLEPHEIEEAGLGQISASR